MRITVIKYGKHIMPPEEKYRPAFTKQEIIYIIGLCSLDKRAGTTEMAFTIAARLKVFALKADLHMIIPAFESSPKVSLEDKLGLGDETLISKRQRAYEKFKLNPEYCSNIEIQMANTYLYENGLMTEEQEKAYESIRK